MYRVLIVDDEPEIRQGLRLKVDWESLGFQIAGEAANGTEALERLANEAIDVVLTDMNMPVMDGISFLDACREQYPVLRLIVITGYEDFQYAKAAIRSQARNYLLKPVARDELTEALANVKKELDEQRRHRDEEAFIRWRLSQYYKEMKEQFIVRLVKDEPDSLRLDRDRSRLFELDSWDNKTVRFMTVGLQERADAAASPERTPDKFRLPLEAICRECAEPFHDEVHVFRDANYPGLMHFVLPDNEERRKAFAEALSRNVSAFLGFELAIGVGRPVTGFGQWKEGYTASLLDWSLQGSGLPEDLRHSACQAALPEETVKVIVRYLSRGEREAFEQAVRRELQEAIGMSKARFYKVIFQLYLAIESVAYDARVPLESGDQLWLRPEIALSFDSAEKAVRFLNRLALKIVHRLKSESGEADSSLIKAAQKFIDENYMYDLNLTMIAEKFNYNPSYFSEMFKSKVGKSFIQYVNEVRMEHAVRLLEETTLSLWDIAELTGFSNASYFSSKFKRMYGMTPSDYRQRASVKFESENPKK
jgi:two-component system response regulator YesN